MPGTKSSWRQLSDVVEALIQSIEPAPTTTTKANQQGKAHTR